MRFIGLYNPPSRNPRNETIVVIAWRTRDWKGTRGHVNARHQTTSTWRVHLRADTNIRGLWHPDRRRAGIGTRKIGVSLLPETHNPQAVVLLRSPDPTGFRSRSTFTVLLRVLDRVCRPRKYNRISRIFRSSALLFFHRGIRFVGRTKPIKRSTLGQIVEEKGEKISEDKSHFRAGSRI